LSELLQRGDGPMGIKIMRTPRWVMACYAIIVLAGILAALPNLFTAQQLASMPGWGSKQQVTLGLDLRGGAHLVLELDEPALKTARLQSLVEEARNSGIVGKVTKGIVPKGGAPAANN
jgi:preprotein translocase subunit SecD